MRWIEVSLSRILDSLESGSRPRGGAPGLTSGIPSLGGEHIDDQGGFRFSNIRYIPPEHYRAMVTGRIHRFDILIVKDGATTGKTALVRENFPFNEAAVNEHVFITRVNQFLADPAFIFYFLFSQRGQAEILRDHRGATIGGISRRFADLTQIPLPPLSEQRRIVEILDQADALRKKRAEADAKSARILPALFYKMFGDPIENPHGFATEIVGNLLTLLRNGTTAEQNQDGRGYPVTRIETISEGVINPDRVRYVDFDNSELKKWRLELGDILFSHINSESHIGKTAIYKGHPDPLVHGMNLLLMRPDARQVRPEYLFAVLNTESVRAVWRQRCKRAVNQASLNQKDISSLEVGVPPIDLQNRFCQLANTLFTQVEAQQKATEKIKRLFYNLLHRAFTGDLTTKWRESHMKELLQEMEQQAKALRAEGAKGI